MGKSKQMAVAKGMKAEVLEGFSQWMKKVSRQSISAKAAGKRIMRAASRPSEKRVQANAKGRFSSPGIFKRNPPEAVPD